MFLMSLVYTKAAWGQENNDERILNYSLSYPLYKNLKYSKAQETLYSGKLSPGPPVTILCL